MSNTENNVRSMNRKSYSTLRLVTALIFLALTTLSITGVWVPAWFFSLQPGPLWVRLAAGATATGITLTIVLLALTLVFGRFFCAVLCPLGTCQDGIALVRPKWKTLLPNLQAVRYSIASISLLLLAGGWALFFRYLDPFSRFAAMVTGTSVVIPLLLLVVLVMWKRRIYCVSLCPVGTVLGMVAKFSLWRLQINDTCGGCGRCDAICPTGCIDNATQSIDTERCVLCLKCVSVCPKESIGYAFTDQRATVDTSRRKFLVGSAVVVAAVVVGRGFSHAVQAIARGAENVRHLILPPGAIDSERFARQCTGCQVCTTNCPVGIIKPSPSGFGPVRLEYSDNGCEYNCTQCNTVCPTGALQTLNLANKQWLKIGEAQIDPANCRIVKDGIACSLCAKACPKQAIIMVDSPDGFAVPEVAAFHCIGCGVCQAVCPANPKAIMVRAIEQQPMGF